jgi:hypothetical protein
MVVFGFIKDKKPIKEESNIEAMENRLSNYTRTNSTPLSPNSN